MSHYGAQLGLYTITGRWYAFSGACGRGFTTGGGVVSYRTTSACRRWSQHVCAGDSSRCASPAGVMRLEGDAEMPPTFWSPAPLKGLVGGVKNSSSLDMS